MTLTPVTPPVAVPPAPSYLYALLSLDLKEHGPGRPVTDDQRKTFNEEFAKLKWKKIGGVGTVWWTNWTAPVSQQAVLNTAKEDVAAATKLAGIKNYEVVVTGSNNKPDIFVNP